MSTTYPIGFYWVKINEHWEVAKFLGAMDNEEKDQMWVLCGSEPFYEDSDFSIILPIYPPE